MATQKQIDANRRNALLGGRKPGYAAVQAEKKRELTAKLLDKHWKPIILATIKDAKKGDNEARKFLRDTAYGKPKETLDANLIGNFSLLTLGREADEHEK